MAFNMSKGTLNHPVLQVVRAHSDTYASSSSNSWASNPIGTVNITPQNSGNLIMIMYTACVSANSGNDIAIRLLANGTSVMQASNGRNLLGAMQSSTAQSNWAGANSTCIFWHEPNSTSQQGYLVQHRMQTGGSGTFYFNGTGATSGGDSWGSRSFMTIMEIGDV